VITRNAPLLDQIFSIPINERQFLVYAPLKETAFLSNRALIKKIVERCERRERDELELSFLEKAGFFDPEPIPEDPLGPLGAIYDTAILFPTNRCNLRCTYCYASSGDFASRDMPWDVAKAAMDIVFASVIKNGSRKMTLGFHGGGEPSMNVALIERAARYAGDLVAGTGVSLAITGAFNGAWDRATRETLLGLCTDISVSFDGLERVQNAQRPIVGGEASFASVCETLDALDAARVAYGIRMTVTDDSVGLLRDSVDFIRGRFKPRRIQVEPVFNEGRALSDVPTFTKDGEFVAQFIAASALAEAAGTSLFYSGAQIDRLTCRFCLAPLRALIVAPDGTITTCVEVFDGAHPLATDFSIGRISEGKATLDEAKLRSLRARNVYASPKCESCFCKWHCAGDCA
jgi:uncharacterized protein